MAIRVTLDGQPSPTKTRRRMQRSALVPAAAAAPVERKSSRLTPTELALSGDAIELFTAAVGGRAQLLATLAIADNEATSDKVVNLLLDPHYASWSLRQLCRHVGITVADLFASYKKARFVEAHIAAAHIIASKLPPIVDDVMTRAAPTPIPCPRCHGDPTTPGTTDCPVCTGTGHVLSEPDLDRQKLALELARLTNQHKGGVIVQQNVAAGTAVMAQGVGSLEQLQQAVGDLLFAPGRRRAAAPEPTVEATTVEATVIPPHTPTEEQTDATDAGRA